MSLKFSLSFLKWLGLFLLIPSLILNLILFQKNKTNNQDIKVLGVIDGDTLVLDGKVRVRLRNIDAPELQFCGGKEAKEKLESLVNGKKVDIQEKIIDTQGRPMALIYVGDQLINEEMLKSGWARWHNDTSSQKVKLKAAADSARLNKLGIYSSLCWQIENPDNPACNIKGNIDKNSDRRNYYFPGCPQYDFTIVEKDLGEAWFCAEKEAQTAGFTRALNCP